MINIIYGMSNNNVQNKLYTLLFDQKIKYTFFDQTNEEIISMLKQTNLFDESDQSHDIVVIHNAKFLVNDKKSSIEFINELIECDQQIYCLVTAKSVSSFNKIVIKNKNKFNLIKATAFNEQDKLLFVNKLTKTHQINFDCEKTRNVFINQLANDPFLILNEIKKLECYSVSDKITEDILAKLVFNEVDELIFNLIEYILLKKHYLAINLYNQLLRRKIQTTVIIATIAAQLIDLKIQKQLFLVNHFSNIYYLSEQTKIPYFILNKNFNLLRNINLSRINKLLDKLVLIDYNIKCYQSLPELEFKLFILED